MSLLIDRLESVSKTIDGVRQSMRSHEDGLDWWNRHLLDAHTELASIAEVLSRPAFQHLLGEHMSGPAYDCILCDEIAMRPRNYTP